MAATDLRTVIPEEEWPAWLLCDACPRMWRPYWFQSSDCTCGRAGRTGHVDKREATDDTDDPDDDRSRFDRMFFPLRKAMPRPTLTPGTDTSPRLLRARLDGIVKHLEGHTEGDRNDALLWCACRFGDMLVAGELNDPQAAADTLTSVALSIGLEPNEIRGTIASGFRRTGATA